MLQKIGLVVLVVLVTICALAILTYGWISIVSKGAAVDLVLLLHSPLYWVLVAAVVFAAVWLVKKRVLA